MACQLLYLVCAGLFVVLFDQRHSKNTAVPKQR